MAFMTAITGTTRRGAMPLRTVTRRHGTKMIIQPGATKIRRRKRSHGRLSKPPIMADMADARAPGAAGRCGSWLAAIPARNSTWRAIGRGGDTPARRALVLWSFGGAD